MDLYKLFLIFYRTKPPRKIKPKLEPKHDFKLFTYDLVAYPGTPGTTGLPGNIGLPGNDGYSQYISNQLKDTQTYSEYLQKEMNKLPEHVQTPELLNIILNL